MAFRCLPKTQFSELYLNPTNLPLTSISCNYSKAEHVSNSTNSRASIRIIGTGLIQSLISAYELTF